MKAMLANRRNIDHISSAPRATQISHTRTPNYITDQKRLRCAGGSPPAFHRHARELTRRSACGHNAAFEEVLGSNLSE